MRVYRLQAGSAHTGELPNGCVLCRRGSKLVLLVTGRCDTGCFYCPLSKAKKGKDVIYADELLAQSDEDVISEAIAIGAQGTGVTGGDPILELDRTLRLVRLLKERFGEGHHVHLYTSTIDRQAYLALQRAGLDELRIHPPLGLWTRMEESGLAEAVKGLRMKVGIEVPAIPGKDRETEALIRFADSIGLAFVNLNELEFSETNARALSARGIATKTDISAAARGSEELARKMLALGLSIPLHFCSCSYKDSVQLRNRLRRRAKRTARPFELVTDDGTFVKGVIEDSPKEAMHLLAEKFEVPQELMHLDEEKGRLEVASWVLLELSTQLPYDSFVVEEYPTADRLEVEREKLPRKREKKGSTFRPR